MACEDEPAIGVACVGSPMTAAQRAVSETIASGPRHGVPTPFLAMLDAPGLCDAIQRVGVALRYEGSLPDAHRELAILATAGALGCGYEWRYHAPIARQCGVPADAVAATLPMADAPLPAGETGLIIAFCRAAALDSASPGQMRQAVTAFGRGGTTELVAIAGYYGLLARFLKCAGHDLLLPDTADGL